MEEVDTGTEEGFRPNPGDDNNSVNKIEMVTGHMAILLLVVSSATPLSLIFQKDIEYDFRIQVSSNVLM